MFCKQKMRTETTSATAVESLNELEKHRKASQCIMACLPVFIYMVQLPEVSLVSPYGKTKNSAIKPPEFQKPSKKDDKVYTCKTTA